MKTKFQNVFRDKADIWFGESGFDSSTLMQQFGTDNVNIFKTRLNNINDSMYNFIK